MSDYNKRAVDALNHLIALANDGIYGYQKAAEDVNDPILKQMFTQYSKERAVYAGELKREVTKAGGSPDKGGGPLGALHRTWMDIKSAITSGDREAILRTCITGEESAVKAYADFLKEDDWPAVTRSVVSNQLSGLKFALNSIRSLATPFEV